MILVKLVQFEKAFSPICVMLFPIVTSVRLLIPENIFAGIFITSFPNMTAVKFIQPSNILPETNSIDTLLTVTFVNPVHSLNAPPEIIAKL
jgi:hypothetical protein